MKLLLLLCILPISLFSQDLQDGLLLHYNMNNSVMDQSINDNDGSPNNITYVEDRFGNDNSAALFNGEDSFIDLPNIDELKPDMPVSFSFWVRYDSHSHEDRALFNTSLEENVSSGIYFTSGASTGQLAVGFGDGSEFYSASSRRGLGSNAIIETGEWMHIVIVVSATLDMKIYVNCEDPGGTYSGTGGALYYSPQPGSIGRHDQNTGNVLSYYFEGALDDFRYYNRALTEEEALLLCATTELEIDVLVASPPSCKNFTDGIIEVVGVGGIPPYEYSINDSPFGSNNIFEGLDVGSYDVIVRDSQGDEAEASRILESEDEFEIELINISDSACSGVPSGSLEVQAISSNGEIEEFTYSLDAITYQESGLFENLESGLYTVVVQNSEGCIQEINLSITNLDAPQISSVDVDPSCATAEDGSIQVLEDNGLLDVVYSIGNVSNSDGAFDNLNAGQYSIIATSSNGCESSIDVVLSSDVPCEEEEVLCPLLQNRVGMQINKWENETYTIRFNYRSSIDHLESCEYDKLFEMIYFHLVTKSTNSITTHVLFEDYCLDMETISKGDYTPLTEKLQSIEPSFDIIEDIDNIRSFILSVDSGECIKI